MKSKLTAEHVRRVLDYDRITGHFTWKKTGKRAGHLSITTKKNKTACRYILIYTQYKNQAETHAEEVLVWLYCMGEWPAGKINHIDGDATNNALSNLRVV